MLYLFSVGGEAQWAVLAADSGVYCGDIGADMQPLCVIYAFWHAF
jgi:hypothetical protein